MVEGNALSDDKAQIAQSILAYLADNPDAQDTLEGIVEWWLLKQHIKRQTEKVKAALIELVEKGLIIERQGRNLQTYYRINRRKHSQILALLNQSQE